MNFSQLATPYPTSLTQHIYIIQLEEEEEEEGENNKLIFTGMAAFLFFFLPFLVV